MSTNSQAWQLLDNISFRSLRKSLRWPSQGLVLFLAGFVLIYLSPMLFPPKMAQGEVIETNSLGLLIARLGYVALCVGAALETINTRWYVLRAFAPWVACGVFAIGLIFLQGIFVNKTAPLTALAETLPYVWLLLVPAVAMRPANWPWLWLTLFLCCVVMFYYLLALIFVLDSADRAAVLEAGGGASVIFAFFMTDWMFLMLPLARKSGFRLVLLVVFSAGLLGSLIFSNRTPFLLLPIQGAMVFYVGRSCGRDLRIFGSVILAASCLILIGALTLTAGFGKSTVEFFQAGQDGLSERMNEKGDLRSTIMENERWIELEASLASMETKDWVIGKGAGGEWSHPDFHNGDTRTMVHNTWLNCFFLGGFPLFVFYLFPVVIAFRSAVNRSSVFAACAAMYLAFVYFKCPMFNACSRTNAWLMFCLSLGVSMHALRVRKLSRRIARSGVSAAMPAASTLNEIR